MAKIKTVVIIGMFMLVVTAGLVMNYIDNSNNDNEDCPKPFVRGGDSYKFARENYVIIGGNSVPAPEGCIING